MEEISNVKSFSSDKIESDEVERTIEYWRKSFPRGMDKHIFAMVVFEQGLEERDRLTESKLKAYMDRRKNKRIG